MASDLEPHYAMVADALIEGRVVPFLGAGVNLCGRPTDVAWAARGEYLPSGGELSAYLAQKFGYPDEDVRDLVRVSQYVSVRSGSGPLYEELRELFVADYPPTALHRFLATLPALARPGAEAPRYPLILTTNYDDALERAFDAAGEPYDVVTYVADGDHRGKFVHLPAGGAAVVVTSPNTYRDVSTDRRPVIMKVHGAVDRRDAERDSYVITEDHYIDYLTHTEIANLVPVLLAAQLKRSHFLFMGYSLRDWNLRVILHRIWGERRLSYASWAVQLNPHLLEQEFWKRRGVDILAMTLEDYVQGLNDHLQHRAAPGDAAAGGA